MAFWRAWKTGGVTEPLLGEDQEGQRRDWEGRISSSLSNRSSQHASSVKMKKVGADRGTGLYQLEREKLGLPSLVQGGSCMSCLDMDSQLHHTSIRPTTPSLATSGRLPSSYKHAGRSRVLYRGHYLSFNLVFQEFFITSIQQKTGVVVAVAAASYMLMYWIWGILYWLIVRFHPGCIYGATTLVESWVFAVITHTTVGYGNTGPQQCWAASWMISVQTIIAILQNAVVVGVVFARISHPKQRGRSIYVSEVAVIARRDGILKFMFRIADVRKTQVVQPSVRAYLYTWGEGRVTAEGESIQVRCEQLHIGYIDGQLLLPLIIEHSIDERSPLCGHTHDSLVALNAEIVVIFEGTTEEGLVQGGFLALLQFGNPFMVRRSYLPTEIAWGHKFKEVIQRPFASGETRFTVNLQQFHEIERQTELPPLPPSELSQLVVSRAKRSVPYPLLGDNTLVLSDVLCLAPNKRGYLCLTCRVADTYPNQMFDLTVRMYLYRWAAPEVVDDDPQEPAFTQHLLECGFRDGADRLYLRLPMEVNHVIDDSSPLATWRDAEGLQADERSEIVVVVSGCILLESENRVRQRTYVVGHHVRPGFRFVPIVKHPAHTRDHKPRVRWGQFHDIAPATTMYLWPALTGGGSPPQTGEGSLGRVSGSEIAQAEAFLERRGLSQAPESHAVARTLEDRGVLRRPSRSLRPLPSISEHSHPARGAGAGAAVTPAGQRYDSRPGRSIGRGVAPERQGWGAGPAVLLPYEERADFTVTALDLQRYAATMGPGGDATLMPGMMGHPHRAPLPGPSFFSQSPSRQPSLDPPGKAQRQGQHGSNPLHTHPHQQAGSQQQYGQQFGQQEGQQGDWQQLEEGAGGGDDQRQGQEEEEEGWERDRDLYEGSMRMGRSRSRASSSPQAVPRWGSGAQVSTGGVYNAAGAGRDEEDAESGIWQQGDFVVGSSGSVAFGAAVAQAGSPEERAQRAAFSFQLRPQGREEGDAPAGFARQEAQTSHDGWKDAQGGVARDVGQWLETLPSALSELQEEQGQGDGAQQRHRSPQHTSPISVPRYRQELPQGSLSSPATGYAALEELSEGRGRDEGSSRSSGAGLQQPEGRPPLPNTSPARPRHRKKTTFEIPPRPRPSPEGTQHEGPAMQDVDEGLHGEERMGSADLSEEGGTTAGSNTKHSLPISFRSESWKRGRSLANLFKMGEGSQKDLMQLKESLRDVEGMLSTGSSSEEEDSEDG